MTTRIAPVGFSSQKNYKTISLADLSGDPDSPSGHWAKWDGSGDTEVLVDFPAAPSAPTGPQGFRVLIRKAGGPGGRLQAWQMELWQSNSGLRVLSYQEDVDLPEEGIVVSGTWDPSLLLDPSGVGVQCKLRQIKDGAYGKPSERRSVEVGGFVWVQSGA